MRPTHFPLHTSSLLAAVFAACVGAPYSATADGPMIRANSASASSQFNGSYAITHAISGAGLPVGFTPASEHAVYAGSNHWTTAANKTIGESATFSFTEAKTIGGFYMWCHQSARGGGGLANNPYYCAVRFDLVLLDALNVPLATYTDLLATPDVPIAQIYGFAAVDNVRAVRFIVRETANNNVSPYTGLAEVAFTSCVTPIVASPGNQGACPGGTARFTASVNGTPPFSYQWRFNGDPINPLLNPSADTATLEITNVSGEVEGIYDCVVTGACESGTSPAATLTVCPSDLDCNSQVDDEDFQLFLSAYNTLDCADPSMPSGCPSDLNTDGVVDDSDFVIFIAAYNQLLCEE